LVALMGGRIWTESRMGHGSTFHFTAQFGRVLPGSSPAFARAGPPQPARLEGMPVLVVDDNETNRLILQEILVNWRMQPGLADSGPAALACMKEAAEAGHPFPLVLLDAMMPGMSGFDLAGELQAHPELAGGTILMLSSAGGEADSARCRELGIAAYLLKPFKR